MEPTRRHDAGERLSGCIQLSRHVRWDIDRDVIRGRAFEPQSKLLPDTLSRTGRLAWLDEAQRRFASRVQARSHVAVLATLARIGARMRFELARTHASADPIASEALVRFSDDAVRHQALFERIERLAADGMPAGYRFVTHAAEFARFALGKARWAVLALCCHAGHATLAHYRASVVADGTLSGLFKDVFYFRWKEASQHAVVDEIEWRRADARLAPAERDRAVDDLAGLVRAIGRSLELQAGDDAAYVAEHAGRPLRGGERQDLADLFLGAYRWQHLGCGFAEPGFAATLRSLLDPAQLARIDAALPARGD